MPSISPVPLAMADWLRATFFFGGLLLAAVLFLYAMFLLAIGLGWRPRKGRR